MHETELHEELERKAKALAAIDASIEAARAQLANPRKEGEREVWETNVVILQVCTTCEFGDIQVMYTISDLHPAEEGRNESM